jgi:hypothetical protein
VIHLQLILGNLSTLVDLEILEHLAAQSVLIVQQHHFVHDLLCPQAIQYYLGLQQALQVPEIQVSKSCTNKSQYLTHTCFPGGPGSPVRPCDPESPDGPGSPVCPSSPAFPGSPLPPIKPCSPGFPGKPGDPATPFGPSGPTVPLLPGGPEGPDLPSSPFGPIAPRSPYNVVKNIQMLMDLRTKSM